MNIQIREITTPDNTDPSTDSASSIFVPNAAKPERFDSVPGAAESEHSGTVPETGKPEASSETDAPAAEAFFLNDFNVDRLFRGIERGDYIFLYYIQMCREEHPEQENVYLAELASAMKLKVTEISKAMERLQDKGYVIWKTDASLGKTYVTFTTKAIELMADEKNRIIKCYEAVVQEIGMGELAETVMALKKIRDIVNRTIVEIE